MNNYFLKRTREKFFFCLFFAFKLQTRPRTDAVPWTVCYQWLLVMTCVPGSEASVPSFTRERKLSCYWKIVLALTAQTVEWNARAHYRFEFFAERLVSSSRCRYDFKICGHSVKRFQVEIYNFLVQRFEILLVGVFFLQEKLSINYELQKSNTFFCTIILEHRYKMYLIYLLQGISKNKKKFEKLI